MSSNTNNNKLGILDKKVLQKTKALFSFVKSKISLPKSSNHTPVSSQHGSENKNQSKNQASFSVPIHEEDFQLSIDNVCNADLLEQIEKVLSNRIEQRELVISDELISEISFMMIRMADYIQSTLDQKEQRAKEKEEFEKLKQEKNDLQIIVDGFNQSMIQYEKVNKIEYEEMQNRYIHEIEALNKQIEILIQEKNLHKKQSDEQIVALIQAKEQLAQFQVHNRSIQNSLDSLNIEMVKLKAIHQGEVSAFINEKSLKGVLTGKNTKHSILSFLSFKDILKMRLINREYNLIITRDFQLQRILIGHISNNYNQKTRELYRRANFFQSISENLPDEVLKVSVIKYLCQRHKVGELLIPALNSAQIIIDGLLFPQDNDSIASQSTQHSVTQSPQSKPIKNNEPNQQNQQNDGIDLLSEYLSGDQDNNVSNVQQQQAQAIQNDGNGSHAKVSQEIPHSDNKDKQSKTQKTFSFMKKLFDKKGTAAQNDLSAQKGQQITVASRNILEKTMQNDYINEELANKLLSDMNARLQIDSRVLSLFQEEKEVTMKQLKLEQDEIHLKLKHLIIQYSSDPKRITHFLDTIQSSFCNMYVFSKFLYQECKALYDLQSYLSYELIQNKIKLEDAQNKLEDTVASKKSLDQMKDYLSSKVKETEKKNLQSDTVFLKSNKLIQELKDDNNHLQVKLSQIEKQKVKSDNNLKILAKEVRNQLRKNKEITSKYEKLLANMNYLKDALGNFKILEE